MRKDPLKQIRERTRDSKRHYFCKKCGALRRAFAIIRLPQEPVPPEWPSCCGRLMQSLDYEKAAAIVKLAKAKRLAWSILGQYVYRGRRKGIWKAALTSRDVERAKDDFASYRKKRMWPLPVPKSSKKLL